MDLLVVVNRDGRQTLLVNLGLTGQHKSEGLASHGGLGVLLKGVHVDDGGILLDVDVCLGLGLNLWYIEIEEWLLTFQVQTGLESFEDWMEGTAASCDALDVQMDLIWLRISHLLRSDLQCGCIDILLGLIWDGNVDDRKDND